MLHSSFSVIRHFQPNHGSILRILNNSAIECSNCLRWTTVLEVFIFLIPWNLCQNSLLFQHHAGANSHYFDENTREKSFSIKIDTLWTTIGCRKSRLFQTQCFIWHISFYFFILIYNYDSFVNNWRWICINFVRLTVYTCTDQLGQRESSFL